MTARVLLAVSSSAARAALRFRLVMRSAEASAVLATAISASTAAWLAATNCSVSVFMDAPFAGLRSRSLCHREARSCCTVRPFYLIIR